MGFYRQPQRPSLDRAAVRIVVSEFVREWEIADLMCGADPFGIESDCLNPSGHDFIISCTEVVCPHCARIFG